MAGENTPVSLIEGRVAHKTNNALRIVFNDGPGDPIATGVQGAGDGKGSKAAILFGFKNGGTGRHVVTYADGSELTVHSKDAAPTVVSRGEVEVATIERGETSTARAAGGTTVFSFAQAPEESRPDVYHLVVTAPDGSTAAHLDVIRKVSGWSVVDRINAIDDYFIWWDRAGAPLKTPLLGTRLTVLRPLTETEKDVLLGACVDITLGLRPYTKSMGAR